MAAATVANPVSLVVHKHMRFLITDSVSRRARAAARLRQGPNGSKARPEASATLLLWRPSLARWLLPRHPGTRESPQSVRSAA